MLAKSKSRGKAATPLRELGNHPDDGEPVQVFEGRYGPYVKHGKINATIPKDHDPTAITLEQALPWLAEKAAKKGVTKRGGKKKDRHQVDCGSKDNQEEIHEEGRPPRRKLDEEVFQ